MCVLRGAGIDVITFLFLLIRTTHWWGQIDGHGYLEPINTGFIRGDGFKVAELG